MPLLYRERRKGPRQTRAILFATLMVSVILACILVVLYFYGDLLLATSLPLTPYLSTRMYL